MSDNGNGIRRFGTLINNFWYVIAIIGVGVSVIAWGVNLRSTVETNHEQVVKQETAVEVLKTKVADLEGSLRGYVAPRELFDAINSGSQRNRSQDERLDKVVQALDGLYNDVQNMRREIAVEMEKSRELERRVQLLENVKK